MPKAKTANPKIARARALRANSTDAERKLWFVLRGRQLGGVKFRRQVPIESYFADFASTKARLIVELDGGQHLDQVGYDTRRTARLEAAGWRVLRFWNTDVLTNVDGVARDILLAVAARRQALGLAERAPSSSHACGVGPSFSRREKD